MYWMNLFNLQRYCFWIPYSASTASVSVSMQELTFSPRTLTLLVAVSLLLCASVSSSHETQKILNLHKAHHSSGNVNNVTTPIVLWHGMGDSCCFSFSMGRLVKLLQEKLPGVYVRSIEIGKTLDEDVMHSFLGKVDDQLSGVCTDLAADPNLHGGFNAIGFSQGGQFLRAYVQRCNTPAVKNLITLGGQHQGVFGLPRCLGENSTLCDMARKLLIDVGAYTDFVQGKLVQAQYWKDPFHMDDYLKKSEFLADINNEKESKNEKYKENLMSLERFVMVKFTSDSMVQPRESEWFGTYENGSDKVEVPLRESQLYTEDWLGLKAMDGEKKLTFLECPGDHLQFTDDWFVNNIVSPYLA